MQTTMASTMTTNTTTRTITPADNIKQKKGWFYSLTRHKKEQQSQPNFYYTAAQHTVTATESNDDTNATDTEGVDISNILSENNNEPLMTSCNATNEESSLAELASCSSRNNIKRKDEKNAFQRFRKKMGLRFPSLRRFCKQSSSTIDGGATTDASSEFVTHSPIHEPLHFNFKRSTISSNNVTAGISAEDTDMIPFTNDFKRFIRKKWLERKEGPNWVMYEASSEMLSQVWYWGEISRCDAQKQLTDKPTGSFLVRDSETSGCQFTLSFRITNVTLHYRLEYRNDYWHFEELQYESIVEMIEDILYRCTNNNFVCFVKVPNEMQPPFPVILKYPLSRYLNMPTLQDLCRRVIQRSTKAEDITKMSIPPGLQEYLFETRELLF